MDTDTVIGTMFVESEVNHIMHAVDLDDNGTKMFGYFSDFKFTTTSEVTDEYLQNLIKHLLKQGKIGFVEIRDYFGFKPKLNALSLGARFIWVVDHRAALEGAGMKEVKLDDYNN